MFRLLAIKYRIRYPLSGKEYKVDEDLTTYLEDKICSSFLRIMESSAWLTILLRLNLNLNKKFIKIINKFKLWI